MLINSLQTFSKNLFLPPRPTLSPLLNNVDNTDLCYFLLGLIAGSYEFLIKVFKYTDLSFLAGCELPGFRDSAYSSGNLQGLVQGRIP